MRAQPAEDVKSDKDFSRPFRPLGWTGLPHPGNRPPASSLGWNLPARWAGLPPVLLGALSGLSCRNHVPFPVAIDLAEQKSQYPKWPFPSRRRHARLPAGRVDRREVAIPKVAFPVATHANRIRCDVSAAPQVAIPKVAFPVATTVTAPAGVTTYTAVAIPKVAFPVATEAVSAYLRSQEKSQYPKWPFPSRLKYWCTLGRE